MVIPKNKIIGIVGLGYVGLPLALEFGKIFKTIGYDISEDKIKNYVHGKDPTGEMKEIDFNKANKITFTSCSSDLSSADFIIISVPTPIDNSNNPDLSPLKFACKTIGKVMKDKSIIIFEPTVYPGATEEVCIPILEKFSGFKWKTNFNVAYSPERINPGDKFYKLKNIIKVISADNDTTLDEVDKLYSSIIKAGTCRASSIKVAEAAKVIENTQRDINIALVNEFAMIFEKLELDTNEVLNVASSKWNFLNFSPGLVGGHCIGVDPYYLTYKAKIAGHHPQLILSGRKINDGMPEYLSKNIIKNFIKLKKDITKSRILVLGLTFKENCSDLRNSKVIDLVKELKSYHCSVKVHDPFVKPNEDLENDIIVEPWKELKEFDIIVAAVSHDYYLKKPIKEILKKFKKEGLFIDIKSSYPKKEINEYGFQVWRL